jgi:hypothetical protein
MNQLQFETVIGAIRESREIINKTLIRNERAAIAQAELKARRAAAGAIPMGSCPAFNKSSGVTWQGD